MILIDYTHPEKIAPLRIQHDRRSAAYYQPLDELPADNPMHSKNWALFRHPEVLTAGSAWLHAFAIRQDLHNYSLSLNLSGELTPVIGSGDYEYDEALAQALRTYGLRPKVAELMPAHTVAQS